jgi:hypothetical protein
VPERPVALAARGQGPQDAAVAALPERIDLHGALAQPQRALPRVLRLGGRALGLQQPQGGVAQLHAAPVRPVGEVARSAPRVEPLQEVPRVQPLRLAPRLAARRAQQQVGIGRQAARPPDAFLFRRERARGQHPAQPAQRLGQRVAGTLLGAFAPQQRRQPRTRVHPRAFEAQEDEEREVLSTQPANGGAIGVVQNGVT